MRRIRFNENSIEIRQYSFPVSSVRENATIPVAQITEVNLNTFPPTVVINHNEVIFIETKYKKEFTNFVKRNKLKVENRFDIWAAINETFLETEFTEHHQELTLQNLEKNGVPRIEVAELREELGELMKGWASVSWEWNYLGHYDLLLNKKQSFLLHFPKDFYWRTMDIALRNYQKSVV